LLPGLPHKGGINRTDALDIGIEEFDEPQNS